MERFVSLLEENQLPDGLYDFSNLDSPPDTAFVEETLCKAQWLLIQDGNPGTARLRDRLKALILKAAGGIAVGGIHTPNHRWEVCSALADANELYADPRYVHRIDDWLGEGIDLDADGQYAERSPNYAAAVVNPALLNLALLQHRPELLEFVRKNLEMTLFQTEPNGEVETVASRRQDEYPSLRKYIWEYYIPYRYLALLDGNPRFAGMARWIETHEMDRLTSDATNMNSAMVYFQQIPDLRRNLPPGEPLPTHYTKVFPLTQMVRIRREGVMATVFGGADRHTIDAYGSGLSTNPTFFKMRKGEAILDSIRLTPGFFATGFFYSEGLTTDPDGYRLRETRSASYHLPLPAQFRRADGQYALSPDGRFFSKLDFADRPRDFKTITMTVVVKEQDGGFAIEFDVAGYPRVPVTIELCFRSGGTLAGVEPLDAAGSKPPGHPGERPDPELQDRFVLKQGMGSYTVGADRIEFGPGTSTQAPGRMESDALAGLPSLSLEGQRVYLTGKTPYHAVLRLK